jgi:hypothetical protein
MLISPLSDSLPLLLARVFFLVMLLFLGLAGRLSGRSCAPCVEIVEAVTDGGRFGNLDGGGMAMEAEDSVRCRPVVVLLVDGFLDMMAELVWIGLRIAMWVSIDVYAAMQPRKASRAREVEPLATCLFTPTLAEDI